MSTKPTNPKDAAATNKIPHALLSPIAKAYWAVAQFAGMIKYGAWNWRRAGVRSSVYLSAMERHIDAYKSGEECDPIDGTHHLGNVMACCAIVLDAEAADKLTDDRPPSVSLRGAYNECQAVMQQLRDRYADKSPRHYTIDDTEVFPFYPPPKKDDGGTPPAAPMDDAEPSISIGEKIMRHIDELKKQGKYPPQPAPLPHIPMPDEKWPFEYERNPMKWGPLPVTSNTDLPPIGATISYATIQ